MVVATLVPYRSFFFSGEVRYDRRTDVPRHFRSLGAFIKHSPGTSRLCRAHPGIFVRSQLFLEPSLPHTPLGMCSLTVYILRVYFVVGRCFFLFFFGCIDG